MVWLFWLVPVAFQKALLMDRNKYRQCVMSLGSVPVIKTYIYKSYSKLMLM